MNSESWRLRSAFVFWSAAEAATNTTPKKSRTRTMSAASTPLLPAGRVDVVAGVSRQVPPRRVGPRELAQVHVGDHQVGAVAQVLEHAVGPCEVALAEERLVPRRLRAAAVRPADEHVVPRGVDR